MHSHGDFLVKVLDQVMSVFLLWVITGLSRLHDQARLRRRIQLTYGRRLRRTNIPRASRVWLRKAGPFCHAAPVGKPVTHIGSPAWIVQDWPVLEMGVVGVGGSGGGLHPGSLDDHAMVHIAPQGDQQLAGQGDDEGLLLPAAGLMDPSVEPAAEGGVRLMAQP